MKQTKEKRRLAIVNDAIQQLVIGAYRTGQYGYVKLPKFLQKLKDNDSLAQAKKHLKEITPEPGKFCGVCAKGSLFLSVIRKENKYKVKDLESEFDTMKTVLTRDGLFNEYNINLIEAYYEQWGFGSYYLHTLSGWVLLSHGDFPYSDSHAGIGPSQEVVNKLVIEHNEVRAKWSKKYPKQTDRLLAILNNMKNNKGVFKPLKEQL